MAEKKGPEAKKQKKMKNKTKVEETDAGDEPGGASGEQQHAITRFPPTFSLAEIKNKQRRQFMFMRLKQEKRKEKLSLRKKNARRREKHLVIRLPQNQFQKQSKISVYMMKQQWIPQMKRWHWMKRQMNLLHISTSRQLQRF
uniref:MGC86358 protein n=1 Tax=Xenopus laevis TaxID=8355 RepID=Q6DDE2_XENLA|nr:MGC86358 protein [Xenopus laevis]